MSDVGTVNWTSDADDDIFAYFSNFDLDNRCAETPMFEDCNQYQDIYPDIVM